jgi:hypothetical protein
VVARNVGRNEAALRLLRAFSETDFTEDLKKFDVPTVIRPRTSTIQAHSHGGDRMATAISAEWQFGYGKHFEMRTDITLFENRDQRPCLSPRFNMLLEAFMGRPAKQVSAEPVPA